MSDRNGNGAAIGASDPNGASGREPPRTPSDSGTKRPLGTVAASAVDGVRTLVRKHVELAKLEATEAISVRATGAGMMAAAGVVALLALAFIAASGAAALALVMPTWAAILVVAVVLLAAAGVLVLVGRRAIRTAPKVELTQETLKEDARWARRQIAR